MAPLTNATLQTTDTASLLICVMIIAPAAYVLDDFKKRPARHCAPFHGLTVSWTDSELVIDLADTGSRPGRALGLLALCPGAHPAAQHHLAAIALDRNSRSIQRRAALQSFLDFLFDLGCARAR